MRVSRSKPLNKALKRNHHPLPTTDDLLPELSRAQVFSVVDVKNGFWHVPLDDEGSKLTTFATPWGPVSVVKDALWYIASS